LAVYGPVVLVLQLHREPIRTAEFVLAIWAIEGILWHWRDTWVLNRRGRARGASWSPEHYS
ncbi:MAG TPA: hypothetical protein VK252_09805, partial [Solirubrobacteraceae bacterium]|nr:hypothetical protein [Solirubrobacteraceae bacterium]